MDFFGKIDFAKGLKTLLGVLILTIPYLDGELVVGNFVFNVPDAFISLLLTEPAVAIGSGLVVYGVGMKFVRSVQLLFPRK